MHATGIQKRKEYFLTQNVMYIICLKSYVGTSKTITIIKDKPRKLVFRNRYSFPDLLTPTNFNCYFWRVTSFQGSLHSELNGI